MGRLISNRRLSLLGLVLVTLAGVMPLHAQKIDLNINGVSDVWELIYTKSALDPNADADGDGVSNFRESVAGTDPLDAKSVAKISAVAHTSTNFAVTIPCALGKQYVLQSNPGTGGLLVSNWITEASIIARTGTVVTLTAPASVASRFFRVGISDVDTDGDGINDWEEYRLGLDPFRASSNGQMDGVGQPLGDYAYAVARLASQNLVTISATDPATYQPDPGQSPADFGQFTVTRGGFPLNSITVSLALAGPGPGYAVENTDHAALARTAVLGAGVSAKNISVIPLANTNRLVPAVAMLSLLPGTGYTVGAFSNAAVTIYPTQTPTGSGLAADYYTNSSSTYASTLNFNPTNKMFSRVDTNIAFTWDTSTPFTNGGRFCVRWTGQVEPQYSELYYFSLNVDDGAKLWVNDQLIIDAWSAHGKSTSLVGTVDLVAGTRYNFKMEYYQNGSSCAATCSWYSATQPKQVIPANRFYPASVAQAATTLVSAQSAVGFINQPFSFAVVGANSATTYTAAPLPPGLVFNGTNGVLSGTPTLAGNFQLMITASNAVGISASSLAVTIVDTGSSVVREVWTNVAGVNISDIPGTAANLTAALGTLEGITDFGNNYAERIRGYLTAPATGNYYFWIAGSDSAELWISNDSEPANKVRRAYVTPSANPAPPPALGSAPRQWTLQPKQKSGWLSLVAGKKYYIEVLHKAGTGAGDNWSVGWLQDPTGTNGTPAGVVPGYVLSPYYPPPPSVAPGTLYVANMLPAAGVTNTSYGTATLRLSADKTRAVLKFSFTGVNSTVTGEHIDNDPYLNVPSLILYDISAATPQADGSYLWNIRGVGGLLASDVLAILNQNKAYITILSANYPNGELIGHFEEVTGSTTFTPPAAPPAWTDDHANANAASRFLLQTTFGPSPTDVANVQSAGFTNWLAAQFSQAPTYHLPLMVSNRSADPTRVYPDTTVFNDWWQISVTAPDQLRQRVAFALSEIMVVSVEGVLQNRGTALTCYYDTLLDNAFGNFRDLLKAVTLTPAMGLYLNMQGNDKGNIITGTHANENYAREILQLFSIGLNRQWPDGSLVMDSAGNLVPTYDQNVIMGFAATFTGWNYYQTNQSSGRLPTGFSPAANYTNPMVLVPTHHDLNSKLVLDNTVLPPAAGAQADSANVDYDTYCSRDLELAIDSIFNNQNVGPFICRQLIQRLVTSNPKPEYLYRVVQKFNDNGAGVRGDMKAVLQAILLDYEARSSTAMAAPEFGKQREPLLRATAMARAFPPPDPITGTYSQLSNQTVTVTTSVPHRLGSSGDTVLLDFADTSGMAAPPKQGYPVTRVTTTTFTFTAPGMLSGTYTQAVNVTVSNAFTGALETTNIIFVALASHGATAGQPVYLRFVNGGAASGVYQLVSATNASSFAVETSEAVNRGGAVVMPKLTGGGFVVTTKTNLSYSTTMPHGLSPGDSVYVNFSAAGSPADGTYQVLTVPDATHFTTIVPTAANQTQNAATVFPLIPPPVPRSGNVTMSWNTWAVNATDAGGTFSLAQTPLSSPTVFNYFFPDYKFPGPLASAGLTTPEFQLTSDTTAAWQMNFLEGGVLSNNNNTNGLSSFSNGGGAIALDLGPWMTPAYTSNAGLPNLVDALNSLLCGGQLSSAAKTNIVNYASTLAYTTPTYTQMRDRARAVVHLITASPDYTIQK
jgi:uncharacterized protein (DUF1800 family)